MTVINLIVGALLLLLGRRLFWLFVGLTGFAAGLVLAGRLLPHQPEGVTIAIGLIVGIVGALLAVFLQRMAVAVAGFLAGALIGNILAASVAADSSAALWVGIIVGGVLGAILLSTVFDLGLIGLSSFIGATLVAQALNLPRETYVVAVIILFILGVAFQSLSGRKPPAPS